ncbi:MAG: Helicase associated domain protein [Lachnospiraceae bacterium]|nr:Helicase associated domain protein [Lachnospiraceae bacterium]
MDNILFEHNHKAYTAAVEMMARTGKAAVVHPTGTGKSFLAFQLCADNAESRICLLSPSEYIFATQREKWISAGGVELKNVQFITYARLMRMREDALARIKPDYIVLDEFHRCGAAQWGKGVERLREMYPKALILGLSATSVRYLDNQRDMAWELFDGNIASELTLGAAVARGILPAPKYVLSIYSYRKELQKYEVRVRQAKSRAVRDEASKTLEALRRALEKADGLAEVFAKHMLPETAGGKYLVFCSDYEHLLEMRTLAPDWFAKVDSAPHIYTAYSDDPAVSEEFEAFKADNSRHLRLLYCIDMLNEGIHVDDVDGVILLRPTVSPTIYKQQIGRALAAGGKKTPVIFDIVMNIENLCSIGVMEEELREAVFLCHANGRKNEIVNERFHVADELGNCRKLFARLNEILGASWETMYAMAREYFAGHGNLEVPAAYTTPEGYSLGAWVATQRKVYAGKTAGSLSKEQTARLEEIGMRWQGAQETAWEQNFSEAEKYFREHGDLSIPKRYVAGSGRRLGAWLQRQRACRRSGRLSVGQVTMLDRIGMVWEPDEPWKVGLRHAEDYFRENGHLKVPYGYVCGDGYRLGKWISNQRSVYAAKQCSGWVKDTGKGVTE